MSKNQKIYKARRAPARRAVAKRAPVRRQRRARVNHCANQIVPAQGDVYDNLGNLVGQGLALAGRTVAKIIGFGDYEIKKNVLMSGNLPEIVNLPKGGGTIIRYQEYLGDIITSSTAGGFKLDSYLINPALVATFPWLSQIGANYEQYSFEGLLFQFKSTSANALNSTNTALGSVMLATNYDATDPNFTSKGEMLNYEYSSSCKPSDSVMHMIECDPHQSVLSELYTRSGELPNNRDKKFYDLGNFQIATTGFQGAGVNIGELHVTYQVRLLKPKLNSTLGEDIAFFNSRVPGNSVTSSLPFGDASLRLFNPANNLALVQVNGQTLRFPQSNVVETFAVTFQWLGTPAAAWAGPAAITFQNMNSPSSVLSNYQIVPPVGTSTPGMEYSFICSTQGNGTTPSLTMSSGTVLPATMQHMSIYIYQIPNSVTIPSI